ncbi:DUF5067 domain-containing protein [Pediococcus damnosus]|uniref:DUF5067 domain-containing protein n=1 Tax=Pediococcus damnosus TaxID=51663 RepID=UPI000C1FD810|nr:DUF5067 domain-containing protein [Pediococcus damnosus]PJE48855.1 phage immunity protein [Pediococcus damnosus]
MKKKNEAGTATKKRPIYKRIWFWLLVLIMIGGIGAIAGGSGNDSSENQADSKTEKQSESTADKSHKVGDEATVGKVSYKLNSVETTDERNEFEDTNPKNAVVAKYTVTNNSDEDVPVGTDLDVYGSDGKKLKSYAVSDNTLDSVASGKKADVEAAYGVDELGNIELHFSPLASFDDAVKFHTTVE